MVEIRGKGGGGGGGEKNYIIHEDCYQHDNTHYTCAKCYEKKEDESNTNQSSGENSQNSSQSQRNQPTKTNYLPWVIGGGIVALEFIGILVYLFTRKKEE